MRALIFCMLMAAANISSAWGPIAHYSLGRDLGYVDKSGNMNLPDAWPSTKNMKTGISDWFCWSHAVQRTGRSLTGMPNVPFYPSDGREPGQIMHVLAKDKLKWKSETEKQAALDTAIGFVGHNAMDRIVHWSYFQEGTFDRWTTQHKTKEEWADYRVWIWRGGGTFDRTGKAKTFFGHEIKLISVCIPIEGNPDIIQISQKVARKNRRTMDYENGKERNSFNTFDTLSKIRSRISGKQKEMDRDIRKMNRKKYDDLIIKGRENNWNEDEMQERYERSRVNAQNWINTYCR